MTRHADAEMLARYREGDLGPVSSWRVRTHLSRCPQCRDVITEIAGVSALLASVQQPPMPENLVARVHQALAHEAALRTAVTQAGLAWPQQPVTVGSREAAGPGLVERARQGLRERRAEQRRRDSPPATSPAWWPFGSRAGLRLAAAAAAVVVLAGGGYEIAHSAGGGQSRGTAVPQLAAPGALPGVGYGPELPYTRDGRVDQVTPMTTSTDFTPGRLGAEVSQVSRYRPSALAAPTAAPHVPEPPLGPSPGAPVSPGSIPVQQDFANIPLAQLDGCVNRIAAGQDVVLVDVARYEGSRATVIVTQASSAGARQVWVVGTGCSASRSDILRHAALPASG